MSFFGKIVIGSFIGCTAALILTYLAADRICDGALTCRLLG